MKILVSLSLCILVASCVSTKMVNSPIGIWDYSITGTPEGDFSGEFIVSVNDGKYSALLKSSVGELTLDDTKFDKATKKLTRTFSYQGTTVFFESITTGETMGGTVSAGGGNFPFKAARKK